MSTERHGVSSSTSPEENAMFLDILQEAPLFGHRKSRSIFGAVLYCVILVMLFLAAVAPYVFDSIEKLIPSLLCSCHVALLLVTGIFQQYFVSQVQKIRLQGYYSFSQKLKHFVRLPFAITAYGTAAMLLVMVWKPHIGILSIVTLLRIIMLTEVICAGSFMSIYIGYLHQYNSLNSQPDILKPLYSPLQQSSPLESLRYHDNGRLSDQQMALLQYQRENLHFLSEEILRLQEALSKYERSNDGSTPQVDLAHMLAAREQELRTVTAEMNQLQSELRLARSLIAESDSEVQKLRTMNSQYVEENERLRAILGNGATEQQNLSEHWRLNVCQIWSCKRSFRHQEIRPVHHLKHTEYGGAHDFETFWYNFFSDTYALGHETSRRKNDIRWFTVNIISYNVLVLKFSQICITEHLMGRTDR